MSAPEGGSMLWLQSGNLRQGQAGKFADWIQKNEDLLKKHAPPGWTYRGDYFYVLGFGRYSVATMWECNSYSDYDALREHDDETWLSLAKEQQKFFTEDIGESVLLREVGDTKILEPEE